jgi:hypothetical protein
MHKIGLIALDLDGTLLDSRKNLSQENLAALQRAADLNIQIVPTTGRFYMGMPEKIRDLSFVRYAITINGAEVLDVKTGEVRSPYPDLQPDSCVKMAFSGIHVISDIVFDIMEEYAKVKGLSEQSHSPRFPIMDFYLSICDKYPVYGVHASGLRMIDVGKLDSLEQAEQLAQTL